MIYYESNYLMHYGTPGMKWGHRKQRIRKGRVSRRQLRAEYRAKNAARVKRYSQTNTAKRNRSRAIGHLVGFAGGVGAGYAANRALSKISKEPAVRIGGTAAAGLGAYFVSSRITRGIANTAQGSTYRQMKKKR